MQKIKEKFEKLRSGVVFIQDNRKRMRMAYRLAKYFGKEWDYIVWIAPADSLKPRKYRIMVENALDDLSDNIFYFVKEHISSIDRQYLKLNYLVDNYRVFCIIDDGINIKNTASAVHQRLHAMRHKFAYRLLLAKNPLTKNIGDIYGQMRFLASEAFNMTERQFFNSYMLQTISEHDIEKRWSEPETEKEALELIKPYILASDFNYNIDVEYVEYWFKLTPKEKEIYEKDKEEHLKHIVWNGYLSVSQMFQYYYTLCEEKIKEFRRILLKISRQNEKVIVYVKFNSEIIFLEEAGLLDGYRYTVMAGANSRLQASLLFEADYNIMVCVYKTKIPLVNLHDCTNLIYFSQTFDYKDKLYIFSKLDVKKIKVYDFFVDTQLEHLIKKNLQRKKKLLSDVCELISSQKVTADEDLSR